MNIYEIEEYAKEKGYDSVKFSIMTVLGKVFIGEFIDAYFGMIRIPELGDDIIMLSALRKEYGSDFFIFTPISE
jgi:L-alanine-DL-glutamate epimerase-like enolase superfamily enzyme